MLKLLVRMVQKPLPGVMCSVVCQKHPSSCENDKLGNTCMLIRHSLIDHLILRSIRFLNSGFLTAEHNVDDINYSLKTIRSLKICVV